MCNWSMCTAAVLRDFDDDYIRREAQAPSPSFSLLGCHWHCPVRANDGPPLPSPPLIEISLRRGSLSFFEVENHFLICDSLVVVCNEWVSGRFLSRALEDRLLYIGGRLMSLMNDRLIHKNKVQPSYNLMTETDNCFRLKEKEGALSRTSVFALWTHLSCCCRCCFGCCCLWHKTEWLKCTQWRLSR